MIRIRPFLLYFCYREKITINLDQHEAGVFVKDGNKGFVDGPVLNNVIAAVIKACGQTGKILCEEILSHNNECIERNNILISLSNRLTE